jgi:TonB family protein
MKQGKKNARRPDRVITAAVLLFFVLLGGGFAYLLSSDKGGGKKVFIAKVDLVRPNLPDKPPPPPREKPPEPEAQKQQSMVAPQDIAPQQAGGPKGDDKPAPEGPLGVEGEGGAGSDGFGLVGRGKGGRDVTTLGTGFGKGGGGTDQAGLQRRFGWYTRIVGDEMNKLVRKRLEENGGIPRGTAEVEVRIELDEQGAVADYRIIRSSGNRAMNEAVKALKYARISQPLPKGIYCGMNYKITSR